MAKNINNKTLECGLNRFPGVIYRRYKESSGIFSYEFLNDTIYSILDLKPDEKIVISPKGYLDAVHWADRYLISQQIEKSEENLESYDEEFRIVSARGDIRWLKGRATVQRIDDGRIMWEGILLDETAQKQAEQKLSIVLENSNDTIINTDKDGTITEANSSVRDMFGYDISFLIGKNISFILAPENREQCETYIKSYLENESSIYDESKTFEYAGVKSNGDDFPIEFSISALRLEGKLSFIILIKDVKEHKEALASLKDTEEKLSTIVSALPCAFFTIVISSETQYQVVYLSEGSSDLFSFTPEDMHKKPEKYTPLIFADDKFDQYVSKIFNTRTLFSFDDEMPNPSKPGRWIQIKASPELLANGTIICHGVIIDVTERRQASERIKYLAYHDNLTGTANRSLLVKEMVSMIDNAKENNGKIAVISLSPVNLGLFYSSSGHDIGDLILKDIAKRIKLSINASDFLAYTSGSLFVIVIPDADNENKITRIVENIIDSFNTPITINDQSFDITINGGIAIYPEHGTDSNSLIRNSNAALERAKKEFTDYKFFTEEIRKAIANAISLRSKLRQALDNGDITPYFQPQIDIATGEIVGTEALARWITEEGSISPGIFIPIAEEYGLIDHIAACILEKACYYNQQWIEQGILSVPVAVNISPRQFHNPKTLLNMIDVVLQNTKLSPDKLEIEVTESSTMVDPLEAEHVIKTLLEKGITCSIDDFGTGYSSLSVLKRFPLNKLKIDRSFVIDITSDYNDASIVSATVAMAKALNLKVLAEGVETKDIFQFLRQVGCNSIQGFLFSKALPADEMVEFAKNWNPQAILDELNRC